MDEAARLTEFLLEIHMHGGKVCPEFETCTHEACRSNVMMWQMADAALSGKTMTDVRQEETRVKLAAAQGQPLAITIQCFKPGCGILIVIPTPAAGQNPACKKCGTFDVVVIDDDRCPDGTLNNCALAGGYEESICQMCNRGPCPEAAKFRTPGFVSRYQDGQDPFGAALDEQMPGKSKRRLR